MRTACITAISACVPTLALTCELPGAPAGWTDPPIAVAADCSFTEAGSEYGFDLSGGPAIDIGGGLVGQGLDSTGACTLTERLVVTDCNSGEMIEVLGQEYGDSLSGGFALTPLYPPEGKLRLSADTSVPELAAISAREGYTYWLNVQERFAEVAPRNRPDFTCGCRLFYPDSAAALN